MNRADAYVTGIAAGVYLAVVVAPSTALLWAFAGTLAFGVIYAIVRLAYQIGRGRRS